MRVDEPPPFGEREDDERSGPRLPFTRRVDERGRSVDEAGPSVDETGRAGMTFSRRVRDGRLNASVFPVPVCATAMTSLPSSATGMASL